MPKAAPEGHQPSEWWVPTDVERRVAGLYWVGDDGGAKLSIHGNLAGSARLFGANPIPYLHGNVMGQAVTVRNARPVEGSIPIVGDVSRTEYDAQVAFEGLLLSEEELTFNKASFSLYSLANWAGWKSWVDADEDDPRLPPRMQHQGVRGQSATVRGARLSLRDDATWTQGPDTTTLRSGCRIELLLIEPVDLADLDYQWLRPTELLLMTATARSADLLHLSVSNSEWVFEGGDEHRRPHGDWVRVRLRTSVDGREPQSSLHYRHRMADFDLNVQLPISFDAADHHRYALERFADSFTDVGVGRETVFINAIQAVESLDAGLHEDQPEPWQEIAIAVIDKATLSAELKSDQRRASRRGAQQAHLRSLSMRLRRVDDETGGLVRDLAGSTWPEDIETLRNAVTHGRTGDALRAIADALVVATAIARMLWDLRWLMVIGFSAEDAQRLTNRRATQWSDAALVKEHAARLHDTVLALRQHQAK